MKDKLPVFQQKTILKKLFILFVGMFFTQYLAAQSAVLNTYIQEGINSNISLKQQSLQLQKAINSIEIARSNLSPKITFAPNYSLAAGGRSLQFPIGDLLNPVYSTLNQLTKSNNFPLVENVNVQFAPNNFQETVVKVQYPIFNSDIKYNILIQEDLLQTEQAKRKALEYELRHNITNAYYQYLRSLEGIRVLEDAKKLLESFLDFNRKLVKNQVTLKDVVLSSEYEISKLNQQITTAKKNSDLAKSYVNFLINRELSTGIQADTSFVSKLPKVTDLASLQQSATLNRPEFETIRMGLRVNETALQMAAKSAKLPQVFVGAVAGFQGFGYTFRNQGFGVIQAGLNWDLYHGKEKKRKAEAAAIEKRITESKLEQVKQQIQLQVMQAFLEYSAAQEAYQNAQEGIRHAEGLYKVVDSRYRNGSALYIEHLKAQTDVQTAKQMVVLAKYDVWIKKATLDKVSGVE